MVLTTGADTGGYSLDFENRGYTSPIVTTDPNWGGNKGNDDQLLAAIIAGLDNQGGGGSSGTPDWYLRGNLDNDTRQLDMTGQNNQFNQQMATAEFEYGKAQDGIANALAQGNFALAQQKQADANYWQGKSLEAQQAMSAADNASAERRASISAGAQVQSSQISAQAQIKSAEIQAAAARQASNQRLQADLANAVNDADQTRAYAAWNQEQAAIAKMEDQTKRQIAANEAKINLFGAETDRMGVAGNLAQKQNEFILNAATSPKDLFGLYFMQRGVAPDWETLANGGTPGQGSPIVPQNALTAYTPQGGFPNLDFSTGSAFGNVGSATGGWSPSDNPFINAGVGGMGNVSAPQEQQQSLQQSMSAHVQPPGVAMTNAANMNAQSAPIIHTGNTPITPPQTPQQYTYYAPQAAADGVQRFAGGTSALPYMMNSQAMKSNAMIKGPTMNGFAGTMNSSRRPPASLDMPNQPAGFTTAQNLMVGDAQAANPNAGGAKPELIHNPTGAPLQIANNQQTNQMMQQQRSPQMLDFAQFSRFPVAGQAQANFNDYRRFFGGTEPFMRYALGTDSSQAYMDSGMGSLYQQSSDNAHLNGMDLPNRLNMLNQQGVPLSPSLVAGATGQVAPTLTLGGAFTGRGGGMLPSLQSLNRMTSGERENFQGYSEGVVGVPWRDTIDYLSGATQNLKTAQKSRGAY